MNVINNAYQSNTKRGEITLPAVAALVTAGQLPFENALLKIVTVGGVAQFSLPTTKADNAFYIGAQYVAGQVSAEVPDQNENCRLKAYGTGNAGDLILLADPTVNAGAQAGMVISVSGSHAPAGASGNWKVIGIAEEVFVDGQDVKVRVLATPFLYETF